MPYIKQDDKDKIIAHGLSSITAIGEVNYLITQLAHKYLNKHGMSYTNVNLLVGELERLAIHITVGSDLSDHRTIDSFDNVIKYFLYGMGNGKFRTRELIGVLRCIQIELYRRVATPYEDLKIKENGDVWELDEKATKKVFGE